MDCKGIDFSINTNATISVFDRILQKRQAKVLIFRKEQSFFVLFFENYLKKQMGIRLIQDFFLEKRFNRIEKTLKQTQVFGHNLHIAFHFLAKG